MARKQVSDKKGKTTKPINFHPQDPKEVLAALLKTPPPKDDSAAQNEAAESSE